MKDQLVPRPPKEKIFYQGYVYMLRAHLHLEDQESEVAYETVSWDSHQREKWMVLLVVAFFLHKIRVNITERT